MTQAHGHLGAGSNQITSAVREFPRNRKSKVRRLPQSLIVLHGDIAALIYVTFLCPGHVKCGVGVDTYTVFHSCEQHKYMCRRNVAQRVSNAHSTTAQETAAFESNYILICPSSKAYCGEQRAPSGWERTVEYGPVPGKCSHLRINRKRLLISTAFSSRRLRHPVSSCGTPGTPIFPSTTAPFDAFLPARYSQSMTAESVGTAMPRHTYTHMHDPRRIHCNAAATSSRSSLVDFPRFTSSFAIACHVAP